MNLDTILDAPAAKRSNFEYAGFWIRVVAYLIDAVLLWIVNIGISYLIYNDYNLYDTNHRGLSYIGLAIGVAYVCGMESSGRQATLGKMAVGIKVGDIDGDRITFSNALGRHFSKFLSALILCIGFMMAGWDPKKQALHDKIAGTYVMYNTGTVLAS